MRNSLLQLESCEDGREDGDKLRGSERQTNETLLEGVSNV